MSLTCWMKDRLCDAGRALVAAAEKGFDDPDDDEDDWEDDEGDWEDDDCPEDWNGKDD